MRLRRALLTACLLALVVPATASAGFVQRSGTNSSLKQAFRFVGHNNYQLTSIAGQYTAAARWTTRRSIGAQDAKAAGANAIRTWFFQSYYHGARQRGRRLIACCGPRPRA